VCSTHSRHLSHTQIEGKNRRFGSAYFGWFRCALVPEKLQEVTEEITHQNDILRHIVIRLTKVEENMPFYYHEAMREDAQVTTIEEKEVLTEATSEKQEEAVEVSDTELDESLEKLTGDDTTPDSHEAAESADAAVDEGATQRSPSTPEEETQK